LAWTFAQSRASVSWLQYLVVALVLGFSDQASAGAWTPDKGRVNLIVSTSISQTPVASSAINTDIYYERGLGRGWALVLTPSFSNKDNVFARNEAQLSLRRALYEQGVWAISAQAGAYVWKEGEADAASTGAEFRLAVGRSFGDGGWANVETALRGCGGVNGLRWEGTLGHKIRQYDRAIIKVFGDSEGCAANITRVQASYVYGFNNRLGLEFGWRETLPNTGNWQERGAVVALWVAF
jgi:hypothetical protein